MHMSIQESQQATRKRNLISKHFSKGVCLCNSCNGTGLEGVRTNNYGDSSWDGSSFCDKCNGIGYLEWKETDLYKLCPRCNGGGLAANGYGNIKCSACNGVGVLDWIQFMRVGDSNERY